MWKAEAVGHQWLWDKDTHPLRGFPRVIKELNRYSSKSYIAPRSGGIVSTVSVTMQQGGGRADLLKMYLRYYHANHAKQGMGRMP